MPPNKLTNIQSALERLNYTVIWKWELGVMPKKPDNVVIARWLPQRDLLGKLINNDSTTIKISQHLHIPIFGVAHPNVKLFWSHGGNLGW